VKNGAVNGSDKSSARNRRDGFAGIAARDFASNKYAYLMVLPVLAFYSLFHYLPMYGAIIAFKDFVPSKGILGSDWIGLVHFQAFIEDFYFLRVVSNTLLISLYSIIWGFPAPIILALLLNELRGGLFKRTVQSITYLPHFMSIIVMCGLIIDFTSRYGLINDLIELMGGQRFSLLLKPEMFVPIYVVSDVWKEVGWGSIIYLATLSTIDPQLYEAAIMDGAGRWRRLIHITLPSLLPTIVILLILRLGRLMNVGFEKIILLYNPMTFVTGDVISSYVYRKGLLEFSYSYSAAVGLFNSAINFLILISANWISKRVNETSLW
jgi:putative aldouronate transport system permease protein